MGLPNKQDGFLPVLFVLKEKKGDENGWGVALQRREYISAKARRPNAIVLRLPHRRDSKASLAERVPLGLPNKQDGFLPVLFVLKEKKGDENGWGVALQRREYISAKARRPNAIVLRLPHRRDSKASLAERVPLGLPNKQDGFLPVLFVLKEGKGTRTGGKSPCKDKDIKS